MLDDLSTGSIDNIAHLKRNPRFHYTIDTVTNEPLLAELVDRCDIVVHLAAAVGVKLIVEAPVRTIETNVHGTEVVLKHANKKKKLVLIASTSEVYGKSANVPFREDADLVLGPDVEAPLGVRLQQGDRRVPGAGLLEGAQAAGDHRPAVQHGRAAPDRAVRHGRSRTSSGRRSPGQPITVFGDGTQSRSFTYVGDVVRAMVALIDEPRAVGQVFNIGNGQEIIDRRPRRAASRTMTGSASEIVTHPLRPGLRGGLRGHAAPRARTSRRSARWSATSRPSSSTRSSTRVIEYFRQLSEPAMFGMTETWSCIRGTARPRRRAVVLRRKAKPIRRLLLATGRDRAPVLPEIVQIESTNICNAKCVFCPRDEMHRAPGRDEHRAVPEDRRRVRRARHHARPRAQLRRAVPRPPSRREGPLRQAEGDQGSRR